MSHTLLDDGPFDTEPFSSSFASQAETASRARQREGHRRCPRADFGAGSPRRGSRGALLTCVRELIESRRHEAIIDLEEAKDPFGVSDGDQ